MCLSRPRPPAPPPLPAPPPKPPTRASEASKRARKEQQGKQRNLSGDKANQLTGPRGLMAPVETATTSALGGRAR